ncbi:MAG TPA: L-histidine N(alpha)-methyltransferase [Gammaproteobacteria bacterium]|nr:L-histidine N(alpha)-methyltransferase [Gammaproteobacteria bacterium]
MGATAADISFYDHHPKPANFYREVLDGLSRSPKAIPPKFFYDERGSHLFDAICHTEDYYPTRTELSILRDNADEIAALVGEDCLLVEPGSGNSMKVRVLLDTLRPCAYMPMDISRDYLIAAAENISQDYPWLDVHAACADFTRPMDLPYSPEGARKVAFFPGSSIGNFEPPRAAEFMANVAAMVGPGGGLLIGVDLKKDPAVLNAAYNDSEGVTAAFNLNLLERINRELDADFDLGAFRHHAFFNEELGRMEMHLVSERDQSVRVDERRFEFAEGESIHTECSYKYHIEEFQALADQAGFAATQVWTDPKGQFSVHFFEVNK